MTIPYVLMALPGPGDALMKRGLELGHPPVLVVRASPADFDAYAVPSVSADGHWLSEATSRGAQALVVANWEQRIPTSLLGDLKYGAWNVHPSLLPSYRGHNPYFHVLARGETETGVTVHALTESLDRGPILLQRRLSISNDETLGSLWHRLSALAAETWFDALELLERGPVEVVPQPEGDFPRAPAVRPADLELKETMTCTTALRLIRAANPFYGARLVLRGRSAKVYAADAWSGEAGAESTETLIRCADGWIRALILDVDAFGLVTGEEWVRRSRELLDASVRI